jgi:sugar phosphate isomerase/epimerase
MTARPGPSIQCSTGPFWAFELEDTLDRLAESGFTEIELMVTRDPRTHEPDIPFRLATERGLEIRSIHGPFLVMTKLVWGIDPLEKVRRGVEMCLAVGAETFIVHPPFLWERQFARWVTRESEEFSVACGVRIVVETMYPKWVRDRRVGGYRWLTPAQLATAAPHVALDTSHLVLARQDIFESLDILASKLVHVHLSNNAGDGRDGHLQLEEGVLPMGRFLAELKRRDYAHAVALELAVSRYLERPSGELVEMLRRNLEFVQDRLTRDSILDE